MIDRHVVVDREEGVGTGVVLGAVLVLLVVVIGLFFVFGGPSRFVSGNGTPSQTNVNVPAQNQPQSGPNINIPRQIDVNVNQQPAQGQQPAQQPAQQPQQDAPAR